jgi:hypothetical protein
VTLTRPSELDELPDGTTIEILDRRGSLRTKRDGHWRDASKAPESTWNVYAYVNARRWGARVIERGTKK